MEFWLILISGLWLLPGLAAWKWTNWEIDISWAGPGNSVARWWFLPAFLIGGLVSFMVVALD